MRTLILPYKIGSASASALAQALGLRKINLNNSNIHNMQRRIINWGNSGRNLPPDGLGINTIINSLEAVSNASCKLQTMRILQDREVCIPRFTTSRQEAAQWLSEGKKVVSRSILNGNSGNGIGIHTQTSNSELPNAPLFTEYVPKSEEYRVHVIKDVNGRYQVFDVQRKARSRNVPDENVNWEVRNLEGGFIFMREGVTRDNVQPEVWNESIKAINALGLDFGAVDVVWNHRRNSAYVLEVNTAPGLEGTTLERYARTLSLYLAGEGVEEWDPVTNIPTLEVTAPVPPISSTVEEEELPEPTVEASPSPELDSVQGVFFGSVLLPEMGVFRSVGEAQSAIQASPLCRNLQGNISIQSINLN